MGMCDSQRNKDFWATTTTTLLQRTISRSRSDCVMFIIKIKEDICPESSWQGKHDDSVNSKVRLICCQGSITGAIIQPCCQRAPLQCPRGITK